MKLSELLKRMREETGLTQADLRARLNVSKSLVSQMEAGTKNISKTTIDKLYKLFPEYKLEIDKAITEDKLSSIKEITSKEPNISELMQIIESESYNIKVYNLDISKDGEINLNSKYDKEEIVIPAKARKYKNLFGIRIHGNGTRVEDQELLVIHPESKFEWERLNDKIVYVEINKKKYVKQLKYENYKPYLFNFNDVYPPIEVSENVKLLGIMVYSIKEISFE